MVSGRQTDFNWLEANDVVSKASISGKNRHNRLDTLLRIVYIPQVTVTWDDEDQDVRDEADGWKCVGRKDYYLIFHWLKHNALVDHVLTVVVDDIADTAPISHSDTAIVHCLNGLNIETWNWKKMDISSDVIYRAAKNVKEVYLYCSGNNAVLRGWSDSAGLVMLKEASRAAKKDCTLRDLLTFLAQNRSRRGQPGISLVHFTRFGVFFWIC